MSKSVSLATSMALALLLASGLLALVVLTTSAAPAQASFPAPNNGKIVFSRAVTSEAGNYTVEIFAKTPYSTEAQQLTTDETTWDGDPVYSPDGEKIAWISTNRSLEQPLADREQLWVMNADGSDKRRLAAGQVFHEDNPAFSPDGDEVSFSCAMQYVGHERDICTARIDGSGVTNLTNTPLKIEHDITWSPSGEWLAFVSDQCIPRGCGMGNEFGPYIKSSATFKVKDDGSSRTRLTPNLPDGSIPDEELAWSPDGTRIAFVRYVYTRDKKIYNAIFTIKPDGSGLTRLTKVYGYERDLAWSPDSTHLAYSYQDPGPDGGLRKIRVDGTNEVHLSENNHDGHVVWAPNGKRIAFRRWITESLYTMKPNGSDKRLVVSAPDVGGFDWQPRP